MGGKVLAEERARIVQNDSLSHAPPRRGPSLKLEINRPAESVQLEDEEEDGDDNDKRPILGSNVYLDSPRVGRVDDDVSPQEIKRRRLIGIATLAGLFLSIMLCVVFLHYLSHHESFGVLPPTQQRFMFSTTTGGARESLEQYTAGVRHTGSPGDQEMAKYIRSKALDFGIEEKYVKLEEFEILVNEPETLKIEIQYNKTAPVVIDKMTKFSTKKTTRMPYPAFHLYSKNGSASGPLVYAHYGRSEDYAALEEAGVNVEGAIVLVRMGEISLPAKVVIAGREGAAGIITYNDPSDSGYTRGKTYPDGPWHATDEASFGSVYMGNGDPSTPDGFSASTVDRISVEDVFSPHNTYNILPPIISMPVSAQSASELLKALGNETNVTAKTAPQVFANWTGGALNGTYRIGRSKVNIQMETKNKYSLKKVWNVLVTIPGSREADRYVIVGAPRDSLNAGAVSPGSGNAVFIELLRAIGDLLTNGWMPHRTLLLASFDGEQFGSVGSSEWIDRHFSHLGGRGIVYLNLKDVVRGAGALHCEAAASLRKNVYLMSTEVVQPKIEVDVSKFFSSAKTLSIDENDVDDSEDKGETDPVNTENGRRILTETSADGSILRTIVETPSPAAGFIEGEDEEDDESSLLPLNTTFGHEDLKDSGDSIYSYWLGATKKRHPKATLPKIHLPGSDDRISPFLARLGIPSVELGFDGGYFGVEASRNDSMDWIKRFADPSFTFHRAAAQLYGSIMLSFSDSIFLQYDFTEVARDLRHGESYLQEALRRTGLTGALPMSRLASSIAEFETAALGVIKEIRDLRDSMVNMISGELVVDLKKVREMNTRLLMTEKAFLLPSGLPHMPWLKHALYGISEYNDYRVGYYPGVAQEIKRGNAVTMKRELIRLCQTIEQAADILSTPVL
ncbi:hypothetical protein Poli38472_006682 [Pythium oligandrum]|uniref:Uncharacterized protein n=1 Tax=Pythium oligandrum TaxID=41045 RepID=A0A8K1FEI3_PYTOL|nr:hypothetical protein Poli38472_006682 [Pythium oligandrum]|eukprot:TMW56672.1 hypothetical protein Poli38472_006682 [Pythium oligandrum]